MKQNAKGRKNRFCAAFSFLSWKSAERQKPAKAIKKNSPTQNHRHLFLLRCHQAQARANLTERHQNSSKNAIAPRMPWTVPRGSIPQKIWEEQNKRIHFPTATITKPTTPARVFHVKQKRRTHKHQQVSRSRRPGSPFPPRLAGKGQVGLFAEVKY